AVERRIATSGGLVSRRSFHRVCNSLYVDVVDVGGYIPLVRHANFDDSGLTLRVAAAAARTGIPVKSGVWQQLTSVPPLPSRWSRTTVDDFLTVLTRPQVIIDMDKHGLCQRSDPE